MAFTRITSDPNRMGGAPCIRHLRFPVATVIAMIADGMSTDQIIAEHPRDWDQENVHYLSKVCLTITQQIHYFIALTNMAGLRMPGRDRK